MMPLSLIDFEISSGNGPELPMQVVQPKPTRLKPSLSRSFWRPDLLKYSPTTCEPGASEVFTHGFTVKPLAAALRATRPAAIMTLGLEVLVHDVIAAITTSPWPSVYLRSSTGTRFSISPLLLNSLSIASAKPAFTALSGTRSCGRFGPASDGSTLPSSSLSTSVKTGSGVDLV